MAFLRFYALLLQNAIIIYSNIFNQAAGSVFSFWKFIVRESISIKFYE